MRKPKDFHLKRQFHIFNISKFSSKIKKKLMLSTTVIAKNNRSFRYQIS